MAAILSLCPCCAEFGITGASCTRNRWKWWIEPGKWLWQWWWFWQWQSHPNCVISLIWCYLRHEGTGCCTGTASPILAIQYQMLYTVSGILRRLFICCLCDGVQLHALWDTWLANYRVLLVGRCAHLNNHFLPTFISTTQLHRDACMLRLQHNMS